MCDNAVCKSGLVQVRANLKHRLKLYHFLLLHLVSHYKNWTPDKTTANNKANNQNTKAERDHIWIRSAGSLTSQGETNWHRTKADHMYANTRGRGDNETQVKSRRLITKVGKLHRMRERKKTHSPNKSGGHVTTDAKKIIKYNIFRHDTNHQLLFLPTDMKVSPCGHSGQYFNGYQRSGPLILGGSA